MSAKLSLNVETRLDELQRLAAAVEDLGRRESWHPNLVFQVNLVVEELVTNIMNHSPALQTPAGSGPREDLHEIEVMLTSESDALTISVTDNGQPFDPLNDAPPPDLTAPLEDRPVGGLGLHLVRAMMDELHYRREQGKNHLTLTKRRVES